MYIRLVHISITFELICVHYWLKDTAHAFGTIGGLVAAKLSCIADCCIIIVYTNYTFSCLLVIINLILEVKRWRRLRSDCRLKSSWGMSIYYMRLEVVQTNLATIETL